MASSTRSFGWGKGIPTVVCKETLEAEICSTTPRYFRTRGPVRLGRASALTYRCPTQSPLAAAVSPPDRSTHCIGARHRLTPVAFRTTRVAKLVPLGSQIATDARSESLRSR